MSEVQAQDKAIEGDAVVIDEDDDKDFDSGFEGADLPTETPEDESSNNFDNQSDAGATPAAEPKYRQITEDEFNTLMQGVTGMNEMRATLEKQFGTAFGKIGGIERIIKDLQQQTPLGEDVEITDADFEELKEEYGDVMTAAQVAGLKRVISKLKGTGHAGAVDEGRLHELIAPTLSQTSESTVQRAKTEIAAETLSETHADWQDVIGVPDESGNVPDTEYRRWLATQPEDYQAKVNNTYSPIVIGKSIDKFNEHKEALKKKTDSARRDRFESAVTPKGDGGHPPGPDEDDEFDSGFAEG